MNQNLFEMYIGVTINFQKNLTMSIKFRITKYLAVSALAMLLIRSLLQKTTFISTSPILTKKNGNGHPSGNDSGNNNGNPSKEGITLVTFSASVEGRNITRAMSPMGKGLQSWLCAYLSNTSNIITEILLPKVHTSPPPPAYWQATTDIKCILATTFYNFYAVFPAIPRIPPRPLPTDIRPFIQWSRLSLVARYAPRRDKLPRSTFRSPTSTQLRK